MGFRVRGDESVAKGLRRVVRKELRSAIDRLTSDASGETLHEARKSIKKVRAVLQLLEDEIEGDGADKRLRRAGHLLSSLRDADVAIETVRSLSPRRDRELAKVLANVGSRLEARKIELRAAADRDRPSVTVARTLDRVRRDAREWRWKKAGVSVLGKAIRRSYKRARSAMEDARATPLPDAFHDWRKRVKTLWYGLRLLEDRAPQVRQVITGFKQLETALGDDHNLFVLQEHSGDARLRRLTEPRQKALREQALRLGARLFARPPKTFEKWLTATRAGIGRAGSPRDDSRGRRTYTRARAR